MLLLNEKDKVQTEASGPTFFISGDVMCLWSSSFCVFELFDAAGRRRVPTRHERPTKRKKAADGQRGPPSFIWI